MLEGNFGADVQELDGDNGYFLPFSVGNDVRSVSMRSVNSIREHPWMEARRLNNVFYGNLIRKKGSHLGTCYPVLLKDKADEILCFP